MINNKLIASIAEKLTKQANKNHVFREKLVGNLVKVPVLKNFDSITIASSDAGAFLLKDPIFISYKSVPTLQYLVRAQIPKESLTEDNIEDVMKELANSLEKNIGLREHVITYGPMGRLTFKLPGRGPETYLLETADGLNYELRAYADIATGVRE